MIKRINVKVKDVTPLLMNRFPYEPIEAIEKKSIEEQAEIAAYRDPDTKLLYVPGIALQSCFINAAIYSKGKGRASLQKPVAACVMVFPERISLGVKDYAIDSRPVVNPTTRGRIMKHRPRLDNWQLKFEIEYDDALLTETQLRRIVDDAGQRVGLLDFRPAKKGWFGRFIVVEWKD